MTPKFMLLAAHRQDLLLEAREMAAGKALA